jgi:PAS domain S-box-containing protein
MQVCLCGHRTNTRDYAAVKKRKAPPDEAIRLEQAAQMAAERMAFAANALPALIAYLDATPRYVWVNDGYCRWFGRPRREIVGRHPSELLGPAGWAAIKPHIERALAGEEVAFDNRLSEDGAPHDVRAAYVPHRDAGGAVVGFVVLVTDITETKAAERALQRSERLLDQSQAAAQVGSWEVIFDEKNEEVPGSFVWSSETYKIFGFEPSTKATLALFYSRVHPEESGAIKARALPNLARAEPYESEYRIVRTDGEVRVLHSWLNFDRAADGSTHVFGTCQDITERKRAELEIRSAREQLQLVVDTAPAMIARYNREQRVVWVNKNYAARFGKAPDQLVGSHLRDLVGEAAFRVIDPLCARVLTGKSLQVEVEIPYPGGSRWMHMAASPTLDAAGVADGCVAVLTDVTDGRRLEQERESALNELREVDRRKDEFLAMLSHELRNPLAPILNAVQILDRLGPDQEDVAAQCREIVARQATHMKRLLDDLLDVARVSEGKIQLRKQRIDLHALLGQVVEGSRALMIEKQHQLSLSLAPQAMSLDADPTRLIQVFDNLLHNAAKYTDAGGHVAIEAVVEDGQAVVTVRDDGVGMAPDLLARAFDLFAQGTRAPDRTQGGLGIGLTLVQTLVRMHDGSVRAFSEGPGRGSRVVVRLPLASSAEPPVVREQSPPPPAPSIAGAAPLRVLVVEDKIDAANTLGQLLWLSGHEVSLAHDGPAALAAAAAAPPDLVILDIGLPEMDGYEVAARLRAAGHDGAVLVAITGYGREDDLRRSREAGFAHHLVKPLDFAVLSRIALEVRDRRAGGANRS